MHMFCFNIIKNINKKSILYSVSTLNISTNFGMNNNVQLANNNTNLGKIYFKMKKSENNSFLNKKIKLVDEPFEENNDKGDKENSKESFIKNKHVHDCYTKDNISKKIMINFVDFILKTLNESLDKINKTDMRFKKFGTLKDVTPRQMLELLDNKLIYYILTTCRKTESNIAIIEYCIDNYLTYHDICDIFCKTGSEYYQEFLDSEYFQKFLEKLKSSNFKEDYILKYIDKAKNLIEYIHNFKFRKTRVEQKSLLNKGLTTKIKEFLDPKKYSDEFYEQEILLGELINDSLKNLSADKKSEIKEVLNVKNIESYEINKNNKDVKK